MPCGPFWAFQARRTSSFRSWSCSPRCAETRSSGATVRPSVRLLSALLPRVPLCSRGPHIVSAAVCSVAVRRQQLWESCHFMVKVATTDGVDSEHRASLRQCLHVGLKLTCVRCCFVVFFVILQ